MTSTLVLMRHGKAKAIAEGQLDFDRELSEAGRRALSAELPDMLGAMPPDAGRVEVWASPSIRTMQTAELLVRALRRAGVDVGRDVESCDALWRQDADAFLEEVGECSADMVVAVGHNPFVEVAVEQLTGAKIPIATGGFAALRIAEQSTTAPLTENETKNRLLWFVQGPVSQNWRTMVQMEKVIRQASENVETRLDAFFDDPDDVETMHKFRVSIRTLRSLLAFLKPWQDRAQNQAMQADLKEVVAATSRLRELDVLSEQAAESEGASPGFVEFCESEAAAERERVSEFLAGKGVSKRLSRVRDQAKSIRWRSRPRKCGLPASEVRARFDAMAGELGADLECLDLAKVEETHDVRKSAKRVRYAAENFKELIGDDAVGIAKGMTAHQDNLGAVCDARVNIEIIDGFLERPDLPEPVAWDLALMKAENETFLYSTLRSQGATTES